MDLAAEESTLRRGEQRMTIIRKKGPLKKRAAAPLFWVSTTLVVYGREERHRWGTDPDHIRAHVSDDNDADINSYSQVYSLGLEGFWKE